MRRRLLGLLLVISLVLTGCWNRRELETLGIVLAVGMDYDSDAQEYQVTAQVAKPSAMAGGEGGQGGGGGGGEAFTTVIGRGLTIFEAIRDAAKVSTRRLWWGHTQVVILGDEAARQGVDAPLDFISRDGETRLLYWVLVAKNMKAADLLQGKFTGERMPALGLAALARTAPAHAQSGVDRAIDLFRQLQTPMAAVVGAVEPVAGASPGGKGTQMEYRMEGAGILRKDKLVGYLNAMETRGVLWIRNKVKTGLVVVACPGQPGHVAAEVLHASSDLSPQLDGRGNLFFQVKIQARANLGDQTCTARFAREDQIRMLEAAVEKKVVEEVETGLQGCRRLGVDCFGLGNRLSQVMPQRYAQVQDRWHEASLTMPVKVDVTVRLRQMGGEVIPIEPK